MRAADRHPLAALALLVLFLTGSAVALWGEAQFGGLNDLPVHVEAAGNHPCDAGHNHDLCLACRTIAQHGVPSGAACLDPAGSVADADAFSPASAPPAAPTLGLPRSRAPPVPSA